VVIGTMYPLIIDALGMGKMSVGPPYFNAVFVPLMVPLLIMMIIGPLVSWKNATLKGSFERLYPVLAVGLLAAVVWPLAMGEWGLIPAVMVFIATGIVGTFVVDLLPRIKASNLSERIAKIKKLKASWLGMHVAHIGMAITIVGMAMAASYQSEKDVRLAPGDVVELAGYSFTFKGVQNVRGANYSSQYGTVEVREDGELVAILNPEKRTYDKHMSMPMTQASIDRSVFRDLYISLGDSVGTTGAWIVRVYYKPFMTWLWTGVIIMGIGGVLAISDRRYRVKIKRRLTGRKEENQAVVD
ncbi:MAG: c-type cytochrome biogenesis protein CcmF, partial [Thiomicrorhabdus sp.]|nr:c-type cytochrome biogenesis protein CcmF [Thiomicrorhabdus sp.]